MILMFVLNMRNKVNVSSYIDTSHDSVYHCKVGKLQLSETGVLHETSSTSTSTSTLMIFIKVLTFVTRPSTDSGAAPMYKLKGQSLKIMS